MGALEDFKKPLTEGEVGVDFHAFHEYQKEQYLNYSVYVITDRAIPDVRDGLKPVHRRALYSMRELGIVHTSPYKKSARVVGDVIGKYHPHGDTAVYDAMVRLTQDFSMRYPIIDGQGNFGSLDGDGAAAMRYTECRLDPFAGLLLDEISKGNVDFIPNYDGSEQMPKQLPAQIPLALINPQFGIAVGYATNTLPHNLTETIDASIAMFRDPEISVSGLMSYIKGPDFPLGGQVISSPKVVQEMYETGTGKLQCRARWEVEELAGGDWQLAVNELPYGVSTAAILEQINKISDPDALRGSPKGAKNTQAVKDQMSKAKARKAQLFSLMSDIADDSGKDTGPIRIVVTPKSKKIKPDDLISYLLVNTSMEVNVPVQMNFLNLDGRPETMSLTSLLGQWNSYRFDSVTRRCEARLKKVNDRIHILEGRKNVLLDIDEVISIVRTSDDYTQAKNRLIEHFKLSEIQAEDVLKINLGSLTRMDSLKIDKELSELIKETEYLNGLLSSKVAMVECIIGELEEIKKKFGDDRRTLMQEEASASKDSAAAITVADEPSTIIISKKGWMRARSGHSVDTEKLGFKEGDSLFSTIKCRTVDPIIVMGTSGRAYTVNASEIPGGKGDGVPLNSIVQMESGDQIHAVFPATEGGKVLLYADDGYGFLAETMSMVGKKKAGKVVHKLADGATPHTPILIGSDDKVMCVINNTGYANAFSLDEVKVYPSARGSKLQNLKDGETMVYVGVGDDSIPLPGASGKPYILESDELSAYTKKRAGRGRKLPKGASTH